MLQASWNRLTPEQRQLVADAADTLHRGTDLTAAHTEAIARLGEQVRTVGEAAAQPMAALPAIEAEILTLVAGGVALENICATLGMTSKVVRNHIHRAAMRLGTRGDVATVAAALSRGQLALGTPDHSLPLTREVAHGTLTAREVEVLELATAGLSPAAIAEQLAITTNAVTARLARAGRKLGVEGLIPTVVQAVLQRAVAGAAPQVFAPRTEPRQVSDGSAVVADPVPIAKPERLIKQAVAAELFKTHGIEVLGLDQPNVSVATALSTRNAIMDALEEDPRIRLDVVLVAPMAGNTGAVVWDAGGITDTPPVVMVLNKNLFGNPQKFRATMDAAVHRGHLMAPTGDPAYDTISHEMSHLRDRAARVGDYAGSIEARAFGFLYSHFAGLREAGSLPRETRFDDWLGQLDGYSHGKKARSTQDLLFAAFDTWMSNFQSREALDSWLRDAGLSRREALSSNDILGGDIELGPLYEAWLRQLDPDAKEQILPDRTAGPAEPSLGNLPVFNPPEALAEANNAFGKSAPKDFTHPAYALQALLRGVPVAEVWRNAERRNALAAARAENPGMVPIASEFRPSIAADGTARKILDTWRAMSPAARAATSDHAPASLNPGGPQSFVLDELDRLEREHHQATTGQQTPEPVAPKKNSAAAKAAERWKNRSAFPEELWPQLAESDGRRVDSVAIDLGNEGDEPGLRFDSIAHGDEAQADLVEQQVVELLEGWSDPEYVREIAAAVGASVRWGQGTISLSVELDDGQVHVDLVDITGDHSYVRVEWTLGPTPGPVERAAKQPVERSSKDLDADRILEMFGEDGEDGPPPPYQREVRRIRNAVEARLLELEVEVSSELIDSINLAVSELITNAKKHLFSNAAAAGLAPEEVIDVTVRGEGNEREIHLAVANDIAPGIAAELPKWTDDEQASDRLGGRGTQVLIVESTVAVRHLTFANGHNTIEHSVEYHLAPRGDNFAGTHSRRTARRAAGVRHTTTGRFLRTPQQETDAVPANVTKCAVSTIRAAWADGLDDALVPHQDAEGWDELVAGLTTGLAEIDRPEGSFTAHLDREIDSLLDLKNRRHSAVFVVERNGVAHAYYVTQFNGTILVYDTNTPQLADPDLDGKPIARIRDRDHWNQSFPYIDRAFVAYFESTAGTLSPLAHETGANLRGTTAPVRGQPIGSSELESLRDEVIARRFGVNPDPMLNRVVALLEDLIAVRRGARVTEERRELLERLAYQVPAWLARVGDMAAATTASEQARAEGSADVLRARQESAEVGLGVALADFERVWNRIHQPPADTPAHPAEHLLPDEIGRLHEVAEVILAELTATATDIDKNGWEKSARDAERYAWLTKISGLLDQLLDFSENPDPATMSRARRIQLLDHFRAVSNLLVANKLRNEAEARAATAADREAHLAQARENQTIAANAVRYSVERLGEAQFPADFDPAQPTASVIAAEADDGPEYLDQPEAVVPEQASTESAVAPQQKSAAEPADRRRKDGQRIDPVAMNFGHGDDDDETTPPAGTPWQQPAPTPNATPWRAAGKQPRFGDTIRHQATTEVDEQISLGRLTLTDREKRRLITEITEDISVVLGQILAAGQLKNEHHAVAVSGARIQEYLRLARIRQGLRSALPDAMRSGAHGQELAGLSITELRQRLDRLARTEPDQQRCLVLRHRNGRSVGATARAMGIGVDAVRTLESLGALAIAGVPVGRIAPAADTEPENEPARPRRRSTHSLALLKVTAAFQHALAAADAGDSTAIDALTAIIDQLDNPHHRQVLKLRFLQGMTIPQIAAAMDQPRSAGATKQLRNRAVQVLDQHLDAAERGREQTDPARNAALIAPAGVRAVLGPLARRFRFSRNGRVKFLGGSMLRAEVEVFLGQFLALQPRLTALGAGPWFTATQLRIHQALAKAPLARYSNSYAAPPTTDLADLSQSLQGIRATVEGDGTLRLTVLSSAHTPAGHRMFDDMWMAIGHNVRRISGQWEPNQVLQGNLDTFNRLVQQGYSPDEAAFGTWTGKMARRLGFTEVTVEVDSGNQAVWALFTGPTTSVTSIHNLPYEYLHALKWLLAERLGVDADSVTSELVRAEQASLRGGTATPAETEFIELAEQFLAVSARELRRRPSRVAVSRLAGVSRSGVARVLDADGPHHTDSAQRVLAAARWLGYPLPPALTDAIDPQFARKRFHPPRFLGNGEFTTGHFAERLSVEQIELLSWLAEGKQAIDIERAGKNSHTRASAQVARLAEALGVPVERHLMVIEGIRRGLITSPDNRITDLTRRLTPRQIQTLRLRAQGLTRSDAASEIGVSLGAVQATMAQVLSTLDVENEAEAMAMVIQSLDALECVPWITNMLRALGADLADSTPRTDQNLPAHLGNNVGAHLEPVDLDTVDNPARLAIERLEADPELDTTVVVVGRGNKAHAYLATRIEGKIFVADNLIEGSHGIRPAHTETGDTAQPWKPTYETVDYAYAVGFAQTERGLVPHKAPAEFSIAPEHRKQSVTGAPGERDGRGRFWRRRRTTAEPSTGTSEGRPVAPEDIDKGTPRGKGPRTKRLAGSPGVRRALEDAARHAAETRTDALRPAAQLGVEVANRPLSDIAHDVAEVLRLHGVRAEAVLRGLVINKATAQVLLGENVPKLAARFETASEHIETASWYAAQVRKALAIVVARTVLEAEGAESIAEGVGFVFGKSPRIVVASPLRNQQHLLDVVKPGYRQQAEQAGIPIEYWHIDIDEQGNPTVRAISGSHTEYDPGIRYYIDEADIEWMNQLLDQRSFADKRAEAIASGEPSRDEIPVNDHPNAAEKVELVTYPNGFREIQKTTKKVEHADNEELGSKVLRAVGASAPEVVRLDKRLVAVEFVPGTDAKELGMPKIWHRFFDTPSGRRLAKGDFLLQAFDRYEDVNWLIRERREDAVGYDNSILFKSRPDAKGFIERVSSGENVPISHDIPLAELAADRRAIMELKPEFARLKRPDRFRTVLENLTLLERHAQDGAEPAEPSSEAVLEATLAVLERRAKRLAQKLGLTYHKSPQQWREELAYLKETAPNLQQETDIATLAAVVKLHLHAQMRLWSAGDVADSPETYLELLGQRLADLEEEAERRDASLDPEVINNCAIFVGRVHKALGDDTAPQPVDTDTRWNADDNWKITEETLGAQLRPMQTGGADPIATAVAMIKDKTNTIDRAAVTVDGHIHYIVEVEGKGESGGQILIFDTLINTETDSAPTTQQRNLHVRNYEGDEEGNNKWAPSYTTHTNAFVAYFTTQTDGSATPAHHPLPDSQDREHPVKLLGRTEDPANRPGAGAARDQAGKQTTPPAGNPWQQAATPAQASPWAGSAGTHSGAQSSNTSNPTARTTGTDARDMIGDHIAANGGSWHDALHALAQAIRNAMMPVHPNPVADPARVLNTREAQVLALLLDRKPRQEIADLLGIAPSTVSGAARSAMRKLGARNDAEAVAMTLDALDRQRVLELLVRDMYRKDAAPELNLDQVNDILRGLADHLGVEFRIPVIMAEAVRRGLVSVPDVPTLARPLTADEALILDHRMRGRRRDQIAASLGLPVKTVDKRILQITRMLGVHTEIAAIARLVGTVDAMEAEGIYVVNPEHVVTALAGLRDLEHTFTLTGLRASLPDHANAGVGYLGALITVTAHEFAVGDHESAHTHLSAINDAILALLNRFPRVPELREALGPVFRLRRALLEDPAAAITLAAELDEEGPTRRALDRAVSYLGTAGHPPSALLSESVADQPHSSGTPAQGGSPWTGPAKLTAQQRRIVRMIEAGMTNAEIARELDTSQKTVAARVRKIYDKLGITSRRQLAVPGDAAARRRRASYAPVEMEDTSSHTPETGRLITYDDLYFDADGVLRDENGEPYTSNGWQTFFFVGDTIRTPQAGANHLALWSTFLDAHHVPFAYGSWKVTDGRTIEVVLGSGLVGGAAPQSAASSKFAAQARFELSQCVPPGNLTIQDEQQGFLWKPEAQHLVPTVDELIERRGRGIKVGDPSVITMFAGARTDSWVDLAEWHATGTGLVIGLVVTSMHGNRIPARLNLHLVQGRNGTIAYYDRDDGPDTEFATLAVDAYHGDQIAPWLARSGVEFAGFNPSESVVAEAESTNSAPAASRTEYAPVRILDYVPSEDSDLALERLHINDRGWPVRADGSPLTTRNPRGFLLTTAGELITGDGWPETVINAYLAQGRSIDDIAGIGMWRLAGAITTLDLWGPLTPDESADYTSQAQILDMLGSARADLSRCDPMSANNAASLWSNSEISATATEFVRSHGAGASKRFSGYFATPQPGSASLWAAVGLAEITLTPSGIAVTATLTMPLCEPATFTIEFTMTEGVVTARYLSAELGIDSGRTAAALEVAHARLGAWLAESGGHWAEDSQHAPTEDRTGAVVPPWSPAVATPDNTVQVRSSGRMPTAARPADIAASHEEWFLAQLSTWDPGPAATAWASVFAALRDVLGGNFGGVSMVVESTADGVRVDLLCTSAGRLGAPPENIVARDGSPAVRGGVRTLNDQAKPWRQVTWLEMTHTPSASEGSGRGTPHAGENSRSEAQNRTEGRAVREFLLRRRALVLAYLRGNDVLASFVIADLATKSDAELHRTLAEMEGTHTTETPVSAQLRTARILAQADRTTLNRAIAALETIAREHLRQAIDAVGKNADVDTLPLGAVNKLGAELRAQHDSESGETGGVTTGRTGRQQPGPRIDPVAIDLGDEEATTAHPGSPAHNAVGTTPGKSFGHVHSDQESGAAQQDRDRPVRVANTQTFNALRPACLAEEDTMDAVFGHGARVACYKTPDGGRIWYSAQEHVKNPDNGQYPLIRAAFAMFSGRPAANGGVVLYEGGPMADDHAAEITVDQAAAEGDWWHLKWLAVHHGIPDEGPDVSWADFPTTINPRQEILHHLRAFLSEVRHDQNSWLGDAQGTPEEDDRLAQLRDNEEFYSGLRSWAVNRERRMRETGKWPHRGGPQHHTLDDVLAWYERVLGTPFDPAAKAVDIFDPNRSDDPNPVREITRYEVNYRETLIMDAIDRWIESGTDVFLGFGYSHYTLQKYFLDEKYGEPVIYRHGQMSGELLTGQSVTREQIQRRIAEITQHIGELDDPIAERLWREELRALEYELGQRFPAAHASETDTGSTPEDSRPGSRAQRPRIDPVAIEFDDDEETTAHPGPSEHNTVGTTPGQIEFDSAAPARGRDLLDQLDYEAAAAAESTTAPVGEDVPIVDTAMINIARAQGFDALPAVAGSQDLDVIIAAGRDELFRGVQDLGYSDEFRNGQYLTGIPGTSSFGTGIYASTDRDIALGYAGDRPEGVTRMVLHPEARTIDYADLVAEQEAEIQRLRMEDEALAAARQTENTRARRKKLGTKLEILSDLGRYAAIRGYDAYSLHTPGVGSNYVILNRSAVIIESADRAGAPHAPNDLGTSRNADGTETDSSQRQRIDPVAIDLGDEDAAEPPDRGPDSEPTGPASETPSAPDVSSTTPGRTVESLQLREGVTTAYRELEDVDESDPISESLARATASQFDEHFRLLTPIQRRTLELCYQQGLSHVEAAEVLNAEGTTSVPLVPRAVRTAAAGALRRLARSLAARERSPRSTRQPGRSRANGPPIDHPGAVTGRDQPHARLVAPHCEALYLADPVQASGPESRLRRWRKRRAGAYSTSRTSRQCRNGLWRRCPPKNTQCCCCPRRVCRTRRSLNYIPPRGIWSTGGTPYGGILRISGPGLRGQETGRNSCCGDSGRLPGHQWRRLVPGYRNLQRDRLSHRKPVAAASSCWLSSCPESRSRPS